MKQLIAVSLLLFLGCEVAWAKTKRSKAVYIGGTVSSLKAPARGNLSTDDEELLIFDSGRGDVSIPYEHIKDLVYGQDEGRRLGPARVADPLRLASNNKKHFLTVQYEDENNKRQAAVFELEESSVRVTLATLEARTGRKVEYEGKEGRKN